MPLKKKSVQVPWDLKEGDDNYIKEPWILKKGKEFITIETNNSNRGNFYLQKDDDKRLSLSALQAKLTYHQLIEFGYKLQKSKRKKTKNQEVTDESFWDNQLFFFELEILSFKSDSLATKIIVANDEHLLKCLYVYWNHINLAFSKNIHRRFEWKFQK